MYPKSRGGVPEGMKSKSPARTLVLNPQQAKGLRSLLLRILDRKVAQDVITEAMALKIFDKIQDIYGYGHYDREERERQELRCRKPGYRSCC